MADKTAVFFCSASNKIDPKYNDLAREAIRAACAAGYDIRSGGTVKGTMKVICDEARACGARVTAAIPHFMIGLEYPDLDECEWTPTMSTRKESMREGTCLAVALPGGIGTIDELIETLVLAKLGKYDGKVTALNYEGFYDPLKVLLDHFVTTGMMEQKDRDIISFPETIEEFKSVL